MADKMLLIITLVKEVLDLDTGKAVYDLIKLRLAEYPNITIKAHLTNHFNLEPPLET